MREAFKTVGETYRNAANAWDTLLTLPHSRRAIQLSSIALFLGAVTAGPILLARWNNRKEQAQNAAKTSQGFFNATSTQTNTAVSPELAITTKQSIVGPRQ